MDENIRELPTNLENFFFFLSSVFKRVNFRRGEKLVKLIGGFRLARLRPGQRKKQRERR